MIQNLFKIPSKMAIGYELLSILVLLISYMFLTLGVFFYPGASLAKIGITPWVFVVVAAAMIIIRDRFLIERYPKKIKRLKHIFWRFHETIAVMISILSTIFIFTEYFTFPNFIFSTLGIHYSKLFALAVIMMIISLIQKSSPFFTYHIKKLIALFPIPLLGLAFIFYMQYPDFFRWARSEDQLVEWIQFFLLIISSIVSISIARYYRSKHTILAIVYILAAIVFFFVGGEEISWGQRIFDIETPEAWAEHNIQNEITIHNMGQVFGYVYIGYMLIGLAGSTLWIIKKIVEKYLSPYWRTFLAAIAPSWHYFIYFFIAFLFNFHRVYITDRIGEFLWEEPMELLLIIGIFFFIIEQHARIFPKVYLRVCDLLFRK